MYNVSWEAVVAGAELNLTTASTVPCQHGWEYDMGGYHVSVAVEQDWVGVISFDLSVCPFVLIPIPNIIQRHAVSWRNV